MTAAEMPLTMAPTGRSLQVVRIDAGGGLARRLADLGLTPGVELERLDASEAPSATGWLRGWGLGGLLGGWRRGAEEAPGRRFGPFGRRSRGPRSGEPANPLGSEREPRSFAGWRRGRFRRHVPGHRSGRRLGPSGPGHHRRFGGAVVVELRGSKYVLGYGVGVRIVVSEGREEAEPRRET